MILADLSQTEGCPKRGVRVTVYGSNPWNSWLSFGGNAGPVRTKVDLQNFAKSLLSDLAFLELLRNFSPRLSRTAAPLLSVMVRTPSASVSGIARPALDQCSALYPN
jgi:hypothetical protein